VGRRWDSAAQSESEGRVSGQVAPLLRADSTNGSTQESAALNPCDHLGFVDWAKSLTIQIHVPAHLCASHNACAPSADQNHNP
jgi:hypothetical protein